MACAKTHSIEHIRDLYRMRWLALAGQLLALAVGVFVFHLTLPLAAVMGTLGLLAAINLSTHCYYKKRTFITTKEYFCQLLIDILALFTLLFFTGGVHNPFATLFVLQVVIAANALSVRLTWFFAVLVSALYLLLYLLSGHKHGPLEHQIMELHLTGMLVSFGLLCLLICYFVARTNARLREAQERGRESEQLALLGAFAANAAHQLGTPLSTMSILTDSLAKLALGETAKRKVDLLKGEVERASEIMRELSYKSGHNLAASGGAVELEQFLHELTEEWRARAGEITFKVKRELGQRQVVVDSGLKLALGNIFDNALEAANSQVSVHAYTKGNDLLIQIEDDGPGLTLLQREQLGLPVKSMKEMGLGIGIYLTRSYLRRQGGEIHFQEGELGGLCVLMGLPLERLTL